MLLLISLTFFGKVPVLLIVAEGFVFSMIPATSDYQNVCFLKVFFPSVRKNVSNVGFKF